MTTRHWNAGREQAPGRDAAVRPWCREAAGGGASRQRGDKYARRSG